MSVCDDVCFTTHDEEGAFVGRTPTCVYSRNETSRWIYIGEKAAAPCSDVFELGENKNSFYSPSLCVVTGEHNSNDGRMDSQERVTSHTHTIRDGSLPHHFNIFCEKKRENEPWRINYMKIVKFLCRVNLFLFGNAIYYILFY